MLKKELDDVLTRRGLRTKPWAIEYDESAIALLIERGFTTDLGARPLKRAVEQLLLAPLARAIVEQTAPSGEQFLFVSAQHGEIEVRFIDPDAETVEGHDVDADEPASGDVDMRQFALHASSAQAETRFLLEELRRIGDEVRGDRVQERKRAALAALEEPGFWEDPGRYERLGEAHYLDRLEQALRTAEKLGARLERLRERNGGGRVVAEMLALRLHVLERALAGIERDAPDDVFMSIRAGLGEPGQSEDAERLVAMYLAWAERRGMYAERLGDGGDRVLLLGGLGASTILAAEAGVHVFERRGPEGRPPRRSAITVTLVPRTPAPADGEDVLFAARRALDAVEANRRVVRRYRLEPDPLVRDVVRSYRTGRLDRVLAGDFDLFWSAPSRPMRVDRQIRGGGTRPKRHPRGGGCRHAPRRGPSAPVIVAGLEPIDSASFATDRCRLASNAGWRGSRARRPSPRRGFV